MQEKRESTILGESSFMGLHQATDLTDIFESIKEGSDIYLPIIDARWFGWRHLDDDHRFFLPVFQDELKDYLELPRFINFNVIIYKELRPLELEYIKLVLKEREHCYFSLLVNQAWHAEETLKTLPFYIRDKIVLNFDNGQKKFQLNSIEKKNFSHRASQYLNATSMRISSTIYGESDSFNINKENELTKRALPNPKETLTVLSSQYKAIKYFLTTNPVLFLISVLYSLYGSIRPYLFFLKSILPQRIVGRSALLWSKYIEPIWWHGLVPLWWNYGTGIRKIYYVLKFHYLNRSELPKKITLVLKGKKKPW